MVSIILELDCSIWVNRGMQWAGNMNSISGWLVCNDVIRLFLSKPNANTTKQALRWNLQGKRKRGRTRNSSRRSTERGWLRRLITLFVSLKFKKYRFGRDCGISSIKQLRKIERRPEEHAHKKNFECFWHTIEQLRWTNMVVKNKVLVSSFMLLF